MARLFDDASSQYLEIDSAAVSDFPLAMAAWFNSNDADSNQALIGIFDKDDANLYVRVAAMGADSDQIRAHIVNAGFPSVVANTTTSYSTNTWHHAVGVFNSNNKVRALLDGGGRDAASGDGETHNWDRISIGRSGDSTPQHYMSGLIAEAAIWDLSVWPGATDADKADNFEKIIPSLAAGFSPLFFPLGLAAYWPLVGRTSPEIDKVGGFNLTVNGATVATHPPIIYPRRRQVFVPSAAGGVTVTPSPVTATWSAPAPSTKITTSPTSATAAWSAIAPATTVAASPGPATATWAAPTAGTIVTVSALPATATWSAVAPATTITNTPATVAATWSAPTPKAVMTIGVSAAAAAWSAVAPTTTIRQTPATVTANWSVVSPQLAMTLSVNAASAAWTAPTPTTATGGVVVQVSAATATWTAPTPATILIHSPGPVSAAWSAVVPATAMTITAAPATAAWSAQDPATTISQRPGTVAAAWSAPTPTLKIIARLTAASAAWTAPTPATAKTKVVAVSAASAIWAVAPPSTSLRHTPTPLSLAWSAVTPTITGPTAFRQSSLTWSLPVNNLTWSVPAEIELEWSNPDNDLTWS